MDRRDILRALAAAPLCTVAGRVFAAPAANAKLLVVFMRGGYDAANLLVPFASSFYYEARPNIAVARPGPVANTAIALDADWGLHPALRDTLYPLFQKGQAAFVPFAGTDDLTRSHFETQDSIELGQAINQSRDYGSGFLNRLAEVLAGTAARSRPIAFTEQLPIVLRGTAQVPNMALKSLGKPGVDPRQAAIISSMYRNTTLDVQVSEGFAVRSEVMQEMAGEMEAANRGAISAKGFELEGRRIAKLMKDQFNIGFVDVGGWDTHVGEGGASGYLAGRLEELGRGLAGFADEMGAAWRDTVVVVISEFGRTFRENGNRGTDHGHGSVYWALGGGLHGARIVGEQVRVEQRTLFQNRDYPVLNDYRALFGGLFTRMFGLSAAQLNRVFTGVAPGDLGLL
jgi:uncharacterized protein (DUF1501 family)